MVMTDKKEIAQKKAANNRFKYPNFEKALLQCYGKELKLLVDDGRQIVYQIHTLYANRIVGTTYFALILDQPLNNIQARYVGNDKTTLYSTYKHLPQGDKDPETYLNALSDAVSEIMSNPLWLKSTSGIIL